MPSPVDFSPQEYKYFKWSAIAAAVISVPLTAWWWYNMSGLYLFLVKTELNLTENYYPVSTGVITFILCMAACMIPLALVGRLVGVYGNKSKKSETTAQPQLPSKSISIERAFGVVWLYKNFYKVLGIGIVAFGFVWGMYSVARGLMAGSLTTVDASTLVDYQVQPPSRFVSVEGYADSAKAIVISSRANGEVSYVPFYSTQAEYNLGKKPVIIIKTTDKTAYAGEAQNFTGILSRPPSGVVRELLYIDGVLATNDTWQLDIDETPRKLMAEGLFIFVAMLWSGLVIFYLGRWYQKKKAA